MGHSVTGEPSLKVHEHRELRVLHVSLHEFAFAIASVWECMCTRMHGCLHKCVQECICMSTVMYSSARNLSTHQSLRTTIARRVAVTCGAYHVFGKPMVLPSVSATPLYKPLRSEYHHTQYLTALVRRFVVNRFAKGSITSCQIGKAQACGKMQLGITLRPQLAWLPACGVYACMCVHACVHV
jgi:hypothetical protein